MQKPASGETLFQVTKKQGFLPHDLLSAQTLLKVATVSLCICLQTDAQQSNFTFMPSVDNC